MTNFVLLHKDDPHAAADTHPAPQDFHTGGPGVSLTDVLTHVLAAESTLLLLFKRGGKMQAHSVK